MKVRLKVTNLQIASLVIALALVSMFSFTIAQTPNPSHTGDEIVVTDSFCQQITGHGCIKGGVPSGAILMWRGAISEIPAGWHLCDGTGGTPDLRDRFIVGAGKGYTVGSTGGLNVVELTIAQMPPHSHEIYESGATDATIGGRPQASNSDHYTTTSTQPAGSGAAHENRPPYYALAYIMKL